MPDAAPSNKIDVGDMRTATINAAGRDNAIAASWRMITAAVGRPTRSWFPDLCRTRRLRTPRRTTEFYDLPHPVIRQGKGAVRSRGMRWPGLEPPT